MAESRKESDAERIEKAESYKVEGNEFFTKKEYKSAMKKYHFALLYLKGIGEKHPVTGEQNILTDEWKKRYDETEFGCYNNLAACMIKERKWRKVVEYSDKALKIHPNNVKALFRKGQAHFHLENWDAASDALQQANKIKSDDANIKKYQAKIEHEQKKDREKEKEMCARMFGTKYA